MTVVRNFEHWAALQGAGHLGYGEPALHRSSSSVSRRAWEAAVFEQVARDSTLTTRRNLLRIEYGHLVEAGEIREMTPSELLRDRASGHPDDEAVQAARRILARNEARA